MTLFTLIELTDVPGQPRAKLMLPGPLRIGDKVHLKLKLARQNGGRAEMLFVDGDYRVSSVSFDGTSSPPQQIQVAPVGKPPVWTAVKKQRIPQRVLGPTRYPRTPVL